MNKQEFSILAKAMRSAYQRNNFLNDSGSMSVWYEMLKDIPYNLASRAVMKHIKTDKFPPTIADVRNGAEEAKQELYLTALEERLVYGNESPDVMKLIEQR